MIHPLTVVFFFFLQIVNKFYSQLRGHFISFYPSLSLSLSLSLSYLFLLLLYIRIIFEFVMRVAFFLVHTIILPLTENCEFLFYICNSNTITLGNHSRIASTSNFLSYYFTYIFGNRRCIHVVAYSYCLHGSLSLLIRVSSYELVLVRVTRCARTYTHTARAKFNEPSGTGASLTIVVHAFENVLQIMIATLSALSVIA